MAYQSIMEYNRFVKAHGERLASDKYNEYLAWRKKHFPIKESTPTIGKEMPSFLVFGSDNDYGSKNAYFFSASIDKNKFTQEEYAIAIAHEVDKHITRDSMDTITLYVDVRPRQGWPNVRVHNMINILKHVAYTMTNFFPERLQTLYVFPAPLYAQAVWALVRPCLHKDTASKVNLIRGNVSENAEIPRGIKKIMTQDIIYELSDYRNKVM